MKPIGKTTGIILILTGLAVIFLVVISLEGGSYANNLTDTEEYFVDKIQTQTLNRISAQPIEGLEQSMYMEAYPGLQASDFSNVETLGDTNEAEVETSADAMITARGLATLLDNVATRLDLEVTSESQVDALLVTLSSSARGPGSSDTDSETTSDLAASCGQAGGNWLPQHDECEYASSQWCSNQGGEYTECASACRHNPEAEVCTLQCVPVCQF